MGACPVCNASLSERAVTCTVCDSDLRVVREMDEMPRKMETAALKAEEEGDLATALLYYGLALEADPENPALLKGKARALEASGRTEEALVEWRSAVERDPEDLAALERLGRLEVMRKRNKGRKTAPLAVLAMILALATGWFAHDRMAGQPSRRGEASPPVVLAEAEPSRVLTTPLALEGPAVPEPVDGIDGADPAPPSPGAAVGEETLESQGSDVSEDPGREPNAPNEDVSAEETKSEEGAGDSVPVEEVKTLSRSLPEGIYANGRSGGIVLSGLVRYPWEKHALEAQVLKICDSVVDLTRVVVRHPTAFVYQVRRGDTLCSLAWRFLGNAGGWSCIYRTNQAVIRDPDRLSVGEKLVIVPGKSACSG